MRYCALMILKLTVLCLVVTSCARNRDEIWDDTKSAGRHVKRGFCSLGGKHGDSRQVSSRQEFRAEREYCQNYGDESDFVPLADADHQQLAMAFSERQSYSPGDPQSAIPGIEAFQDPSNTPQTASVFRSIHFPYDSSLVKGSENLEIVSNASSYMRSHPNVYVFVEGHCDERGPEAYNLALGARRANAVRNMLIKEGVNPDNIFTISYGKEHPTVSGHNEEAWALNRRGEFKIYHH